jgi:flagellar motor component MotA
MAAIPWWGWLIVGLFVSISSAISGGALRFFVWIGLIFIIVGVGKLVMVFVTNPKETKKEQQVMHAPQPHQREKHCTRCRLTVLPTDNFCRYCGTRLR